MTRLMAWLMEVLPQSVVAGVLKRAAGGEQTKDGCSSKQQR